MKARLKKHRASIGTDLIIARSIRDAAQKKGETVINLDEDTPGPSFS